jgi:hypothetical protein
MIAIYLICYYIISKEDFKEEDETKENKWNNMQYIKGKNV